MDLSLEYRHRAVSRALSEDGYAVGDVHDVDEVRGTGLLEEDLGPRCLHCVLEFGDRGYRSSPVGVRSRPGIDFAARGTLEVKSEYILGGCRKS